MSITLTQRGTATNVNSLTTHTITPGSAATGPVILVVAGQGGVNIDSVSGGGTGITWTVIAQSSVADNNRLFWIKGVGGTFDTSDISVTFSAAATDFHAHLIDCAGADSAVACHIEFAGSGTNATSLKAPHQQVAASTNRILASILVGGSGAITEEGTELAETFVGDYTCQTQASGEGGYSDDASDWSWSTSRSNLFILAEIIDSGADDGATATRRHLIRGGDAGDDIITAAFTPSANSVVCFAAVTERAANSQDFTSVQDSQGSPKAYSLVSALNVDADHRLHLWSARYSTSPGSITLTGDFPVVLTGAVYYVFELLTTQGTTDTDWGGTPVTNTATGTSLALPSLTMGANGAVLAVWGRDGGTEDFSIEQGYVPMDHLDPNGEGNETNVVWATWLGGDEDPTASATTAASADLAGIALEVLGTVTAATPTTIPRVGAGRRAGN